MINDKNAIFDFSNRKLYNEVYIPLINSKLRHILIYGSRDTGKSDFVAGQCLKHLLKESYSRGILIRKTFNSIKDSQWQTIKDIAIRWGIDHLFRFLTVPLEIHCLINNNKILCRGLDKPEKTKSIKDPTFVWYEEADELTLLEWIKTSQSIRGPKGSLLREYFTFNAEDEESYLNKTFFPDSVESYQKEDGKFHFIRSKKPNSIILHTTYKDNRFCTQERRINHKALKEIDEELYRIYSLGLWGNRREGLVYPRYNIVDELPDEYDYRIFGVDWGFSNDPKVLVEIRVRSNYIYCKEHIYMTHLRVSTMIEMMNELGIPKDEPIYCDTNDPEKTAELNLAGFYALPQYKHDGSVKLGIEEVLYYILNVTEDSENAREEYKNYKWDVKKNRRTENPRKYMDHYMDAKRGAIYTHNKYNNIKVSRFGGEDREERDEIKRITGR